LEVIDLQSSDAMSVTSRDKNYWTLTNLSASDIFNLKDTVLINASVFGSTVGSSTKAAHGIDWTN